MIEKLKRIHYMFYASLVFMGFPFISILLGEVPYWHFFLALLFIASYLGILITENKKLIWIYWLYLLTYWSITLRFAIFALLIFGQFFYRNSYFLELSFSDRMRWSMNGYF